MQARGGDELVVNNFVPSLLTRGRVAIPVTFYVPPAPDDPAAAMRDFGGRRRLVFDEYLFQDELEAEESRLSGPNALLEVFEPVRRGYRGRLTPGQGFPWMVDDVRVVPRRCGLAQHVPRTPAHDIKDMDGYGASGIVSWCSGPVTHVESLEEVLSRHAPNALPPTSPRRAA